MQVEEAAPTGPAEPEVETPDGGRAASTVPLFVLMAVTAFVATVVAVLASLVRNHGHLVYVLDDPAIHMSMAKQLALHGTWGVTTGVYESASSSPAWTLVLAVLTRVVPFALNVLPLLLNMAAAAWLLWLFASEQGFLARVRRNWVGVVLILFTTVFALYIPALAMIGMEHTLHAAIVVEILVVLHRLERRELTVRNTWPLLALFFAGTAVRYETAFLAVGCVVAILVATALGRERDDTPPRWNAVSSVRTSALIAIASGLPIVVYGFVNRAMGQSFLPNSIVAKSVADQHVSLAPDLVGLLQEIQHQPLISLFLVVAFAYAVASIVGPMRPTFTMAAAYVVLVLLHAAYGQFGFYGRYEEYLIIAGLFITLRISSELVPPRLDTAAALVMALVMAALFTVQIGLVVDVPLASNNTYKQRYQMARFFEKYYAGRTVATGELGYVSLFHKGGLLDLLGLGSHQVTALLRQRNGRLTTADNARFVDDAHVVAIGMYPETTLFHTPRSWYFVAEWRLDEKNVSGFDKRLEFYAPNPRLGQELDRNLRAFQPELPTGVTVTYRNDLLRRFLQGLAKNKAGQ